MNNEKASILRLLQEGMGNEVRIIESKLEDDYFEIRASLPDCPGSSLLPVLYLVTSLAFLEAPCDLGLEDGWTLPDFISNLRFENGELSMSLDRVRGRVVATRVQLSSKGVLTIKTLGRGKSATRWLEYVQGRTHLRQVKDPAQAVHTQ